MRFPEPFFFSSLPFLSQSCHLQLVVLFADTIPLNNIEPSDLITKEFDGQNGREMLFHSSYIPRSILIRFFKRYVRTTLIK